MALTLRFSNLPTGTIRKEHGEEDRRTKGWYNRGPKKVKRRYVKKWAGATTCGDCMAGCLLSSPASPSPDWHAALLISTKPDQSEKSYPSSHSSPVLAMYIGYLTALLTLLTLVHGKKHECGPIPYSVCCRKWEGPYPRGYAGTGCVISHDSSWLVSVMAFVKHAMTFLSPAKSL